jgi:hypothetical protein
MSRSHAADQELIARDSAIPGLGSLLQPAMLLDALRGQVNLDHLDNMRLDYVRYKPGMNCIGRYVLTSNGREFLAYAKAFGSDAFQKMRKAAARTEVGGPHGAGRIASHENALLFSWFPNDLKLRSIGRLGSPATRARLLGRIFKHDGDWQESGYEILNYKPERRLVCRLETTTGTAATVKFYTPGEFRRTAHLRRNRAFPERLGVPRHMGGSKKHAVHAFEWLPGENLRAISLNPAQGHDWHRKAGALLTEFHGCAPEALESMPVADTIKSIGEIARQLSFILPATGGLANRLAQRLCGFVAGAQGSDCPVHGDFYDKQIIVSPGGAALIDLDRSRMGTAAEDLGCFLAHLELLCLSEPGFETRRKASLADGLLQGYAEAGGRYLADDLPGWTALSLFRLSHQPFRDRAADWPERTQEILSRTNGLLAEAGIPA